ncbi:MAG TPA: PEP-CTERM sorting domain-containing protein [Gemmatirosa sp.]
MITGATGNEFQINFANPIAAFGFFGSDIGDAGSNLLLRFGRADGTTYTTQVPYDYNTQPLANGNLLFYGLIDTLHPFTSVQFVSTSVGDYFGFDDVTIGAPGQVVNPPGVVPEPATVALVGAGVAVLGAAARRRRTA